MVDDLTNIHGLKIALNLPFDWLKAEADAGSLPCLCVGKHRLFSIQAVRRALAERAAQISEKGGAPCKP